MESLEKTVKLPPPRLKSSTSIEAVLQKRRSVRDYTNVQLSLSEISQLLWSAQGITNQEGYRTAPSAGALFPLEIYLLVNNVENLQTGVYKFNPINHELKLWFEGNIKTELCNSALGQDSITQSAASIIITAVFERVTSKYGKRGITYVHMEAGHAAQNVHLQAEALNIGTVIIGAFDDEKVKKILCLPQDEQPLCIMPVGKK